MKYRYNQYVPAIKRDNKYLFGINKFFSTEEGEFITLSYGQEENLQRLVKGEEAEESELLPIFGKEIWDYFLSNHIFITADIDVSSIYSRSRAYYYMNQLGNVQGVLKGKNVLILGCGGIGSHVAWNMAVLGVEKISVVDYDTVEESNLNRQLLYDMGDIGKLKIEVLKDKLKNINPHVDIHPVPKKIWSAADLEDIVNKEQYDLIIKSLDSPARFPEWLDSVATAYNIPYIAGITVSTVPMIGPTYIPNQTAPYSAFFSETTEYSRIAGISQSLGVIMYHISSEVSMEAFRFLSGKGKLKYANRIYTYDDINNKALILTPKEYANRVSEPITLTKNMANWILLLLVTIICLATKQKVFLVAVPLLAILVPFVFYKENKAIVQTGFMNIIVGFFCQMVVLFSDRNMIRLAGNTNNFLLALCMGMSFYVIAALGISNLILYICRKGEHRKTLGGIL